MRTQDDCYDGDEGANDGDEGANDAGSDSDSSHRISVSVSFEELAVGVCVEVYWKGNDAWYEGEVKEVDDEDRACGWSD